MSKNVLITGASGGIGSAVAEAFAAAGCNVFINYHKNKSAAASLARRINDIYNTEAYILCADVSDRNSVNKMFDTIDGMAYKIDVLVNNSGIAQQKLFTEITSDDWRAMLGVNLDGVFNCTQEVLKRYMLKRHNGAILNISSMWGQTGASCEVHYSASKAGVIGLTKALAKEIGLSGIRVNCICPGVIMTDMMKSFDEQTLSSLKEDTPLNMLGSPEDIAEAAVFLCSDKAKFITGQVLGINGGFVI